MNAPHAKFLASAASPQSYPVEGPPEFAFLGRSNVGKSSLINSLLGQKIAHVSSTPGRTQTINFIGIYRKLEQRDPDLMLVDLPGYGYARVSREVSARWAGFVEPYLKERGTLQLSFVLVDANVPPQESDRQLIEFLRHAKRSFLVVATKSDKLSGNRLRTSLNTLMKEHRLEAILPYSAKTGAGRAEMWREIRGQSAR